MAVVPMPDQLIDTGSGSEDVGDDSVLLTEVPNADAIGGNEVEIESVEMDNHFMPGRSRAAETICLEPSCDFRYS